MTLTKVQDTMLRMLAERHKMSVAWLVRNALDRIVAGRELSIPPTDKSLGVLVRLNSRKTGSIDE